MRVKDKSVHEVSCIGITEVQELPATGCRYQDLTIMDESGIRWTATLYLQPGCNGFRVLANRKEQVTA